MGSVRQCWKKGKDSHGRGRTVSDQYDGMDAYDLIAHVTLKNQTQSPQNFFPARLCGITVK